MRKCSQAVGAHSFVPAILEKSRKLIENREPASDESRSRPLGPGTHTQPPPDI